MYVPIGHYCLSKGLACRTPRASRSKGNAGRHRARHRPGRRRLRPDHRRHGSDVRNFTMVGHSGFENRDQCGFIPMHGSSYFWGFAAKNCNATTISDTQRVLIENCHGRRMASECFVAGGRSRGTPAKPNAAHTKMTTYLRCSAIDCGRNGFNDVSWGSENISVLHCRIVDVGGSAWEGAVALRANSSGTTCATRAPSAMRHIELGKPRAQLSRPWGRPAPVADNVFEARARRTAALRYPTSTSTGARRKSSFATTSSSTTTLRRRGVRSFSDSMPALPSTPPSRATSSI